MHDLGRPHGRGLAKGRSIRVERPLCLHAPPILTSAEFVPMPQVEAKGARPPLGRAGAPLRSMVTQESSLRAVVTSVRHKTQVRLHACSVRLPICVSSPLIPLSRVMCFVFVCRTLAASTSITTGIASVLKAGVAVAVGASIHAASSLSQHAGRSCGRWRRL